MDNISTRKLGLHKATMDGTNAKQNAITSNNAGAVTSKNDILRTRPHIPNLIMSCYGSLNTPFDWYNDIEAWKQ